MSVQKLEVGTKIRYSNTNLPEPVTVRIGYVTEVSKGRVRVCGKRVIVAPDEFFKPGWLLTAKDSKNVEVLTS